MRALILVAVSATAVAAEAPREPQTQAIGGDLGLVIGSSSTAGGVALSGEYLYRLSDKDWFGGRIGISIGGQSPGCFRDRSDNLQCDHGVVDGFSILAGARVRRYFEPQGQFVPYAFAGAAVSLVSFGSDGVFGVGIPLTGGAGIRVTVVDNFALTGSADLNVGGALWSSGLGAEPLFGFGIRVGAEWALD